MSFLFRFISDEGILLKMVSYLQHDADLRRVRIYDGVPHTAILAGFYAESDHRRHF